MKKQIVGMLIVLAIVVVVLVAILGPFRPSAPGTIRIGYLPITVNLPFFVAMEEGYFEKHGLKVEAIRFEATTHLFDAMLAGRIDATAIGSLPALYGIEEKSPGQFQVYALQANDEHNYTDALIVKKDSTIMSPSELKGKRIGTFPGTTIVVGTRLVMRKFNLDDTDYEIVQLPPHLHLQALETGQIDALMALEPTGTIARVKGIGRVILEAPNAKHVINPFPGGAAAFLTTWAKNNPDLAAALKRATDDAIAFINSNPEKAKKVLPKYTGLPEEIASATLLCLYWTVEDADREVVQDFADLLYKEGVFNTAVDTARFYYEPGARK